MIDLNELEKRINDEVDDGIISFALTSTELLHIVNRAIAAESLCEQRRRGAENIVNELSLADKEIAELKAKLADIERQDPVVQQYPFAKLTESQILTKMHPQPIYPFEFNSGKQLKIEPEQQSPAVAVPDDHFHVSEFIDLCKSFSSRTGSIYIGDVEAALQGLLSTPTPSAEKTINTVSNSMPPKNGNGIPKAVGEQKLSDSTLEILEQPDSAAPNKPYAYCAEVMVDGSWVWNCATTYDGELPKVGEHEHCEIRTVIPLYREPSAHKPQRITKQDALGFAMSTLKYWIQVPNGCAEDWLDRYGRTLLAKLNEAKNV